MRCSCEMNLTVYTLNMNQKVREEKQLRQENLWEKILESQIETGTPYMLYKDAANRKI
jgi:ribonucleotide reductase alpha subunit